LVENTPLTSLIVLWISNHPWFRWLSDALLLLIGLAIAWIIWIGYDARGRAVKEAHAAAALIANATCEQAGLAISVALQQPMTPAARAEEIRLSRQYVAPISRALVILGQSPCDGVPPR